MTPEERAAAFNAAALDEAKKLPRIQQDTLAEIVRQLQIAERSVIEALRQSQSESATRRLRRLKDEIERALQAWQQAATQAATGGAEAAWQAAITSLRAPMQAAGLAQVSLTGASINAGALLAAKRFMTSRIADLSLSAVNRLNAQLVQHLIGTQSLSDTITEVQRIMRGAARSRAMTVTYTEIGRAYSIAHQDALERDAHMMPNLHKRWMKSGKLHPRPTHVDANGQIRKWNEPYIIDGEKLMFPRDPDGSPGNTINCGCHSIPVVDGSSFGNVGTVRINSDDNAEIELPSGRRVKPPLAPRPK
jgi:hypothetical protein